MRRLLFIVCLSGIASAVRATPLPAAAPSFDFARDVAPVLARSCVGCHGPGKQNGRLRLDSAAGLTKGGENGPVIKPGDSAASVLIRAMARVDEDSAMPPDDDQAVAAVDIARLRAWIDAGARWPEGVTLQPPHVVAKPLPPAATRAVSFAADIRSLLDRHCLGCHGPKKQEGNLRFDHKPTLFAAREPRPVLVAGKSAESLIVQLVAATEGAVMPPKGPRLSAQEIGLLRAWIDQGAEYPDGLSVQLKDNRDHWAWKPPRRPPVPPLRSWGRNAIDAFVLARLDRERLSPSPEADRATLVRRLHLDLTGLPPTPAEVDASVADRRPDAYDRVVSRLLASPHHGERWARPWLDAARYADSDGFEKDKSRQMHAYRDWVIQALNGDMPYDRFIVEQIAGDLVPGATQAQIVATGFLRNSMLNEEGGVHPEQFRVEGLFDRMDAIGRAVLGVTIQCAQCHTHKFDPISHDEYYRLFAFLNDDDEAIRAVYTPEEERTRATLLAQVAAEERSLQRHFPQWRTLLERWQADQRRMNQPRWVTLQAPFIDDSTAGQKYLPLKDGSYLAQSYAPTKHDAKVVLRTDLSRIGALRLELLNDPNLPLGGPGRSYKGTCALTDLEVEAAPASAPDKKHKVKWRTATADYAQPEAPLEPAFHDRTDKRRVVGPVTFAIDGKEETAWGIDAGPGRRNVPRQAVFVPEQPIVHAGGVILTVTLRQRHGGWNSDDHQNNNLGRFRIAVSEEAGAADPVPSVLRVILQTPRPTAAQQEQLFSYFRTTVPAWSAFNRRTDQLWSRHPEGSTALVLQRRPPGDERQTRLFKRGDFLTPGKLVTPGVPAFLHSLPPHAPPTRLGLARWLVDPRSPTTARVLVNRVWQGYFGTGLVATPDDFGTQGEAPSHPELLDWLATEFQARGWRMKELHRLIVTSATYRQASRVPPALLERDPQNRLLARGARFRVDAEVVRDLFLASSGLLNPKVGGRSVMPPAPAFLFAPPASYAPFPWVDETGPDKYRRALYTFRRRSTPFPLLQAFDAPNGETSCVRRPRSNTPLQALVTLNEPLSMEAAQALGRRMLEAARDDGQRLVHGFRGVLARAPTADELAELQALLQRQRQRLRDGWADPWQIATGTPAVPTALPAGGTPAELAAFTVVARVILNLDEAITRE